MRKMMITLALVGSLGVPLQAQSPLDWPSIIAAAGAAAADTYTTTHGLASGGCHESNALYGRHPSATTLWAGTAFSITALITLNYAAAQSPSKGFQRFVKGFTWALVALEGGLAIHNIRTCY